MAPYDLTVVVPAADSPHQKGQNRAAAFIEQLIKIYEKLRKVLTETLAKYNYKSMHDR